jgi:uncharacterized protein YjiS (DUF1127 family)
MSVLVFTGFRRRNPRVTAGADILAGIRAFFGRMAKERRTRAATRQLRSLSDWQLRDIGMHRSQILYLGISDATISARGGHAAD